jgi:hypothetical protein
MCQQILVSRSRCRDRSLQLYEALMTLHDHREVCFDTEVVFAYIVPLTDKFEYVRLWHPYWPLWVVAGVRDCFPHLSHVTLRLLMWFKSCCLLDNDRI